MQEGPYNDAHVDRFRPIISEHANCDMHCHPCQPFCLRALTALATIAGDPDAHFPQTCIEGVPLGVEEYLPPYTTARSTTLTPGYNATNANARIGSDADAD